MIIILRGCDTIQTYVPTFHPSGGVGLPEGTVCIHDGHKDHEDGMNRWQVHHSGSALAGTWSRTESITVADLPWVYGEGFDDYLRCHHCKALLRPLEARLMVPTRPGIIWHPHDQRVECAAGCDTWG